MEKLWFSILYVALIGILSNPFAASFSRDFSYGAFPFAP